MNPTKCTDDHISINTITIVGDSNQTANFIEGDRLDNIPDKELVTFKLIVFVSLVSFVFLAKVYFVPAVSVQCLNDPIHNFLTFINDQVNQGNTFSRILQISSSLLMDISFITVLVYWALYTKSSRLVLVISLFYIFRAFNQLLIQMTKPNGFYWNDPGFPSIVVPYGFTSDFFFSGHTGFLTICLFEWREIKKTKMVMTTSVILIYMIFVLLVFRTHYSIDIMMGFVCAHYIFNLINQNIKTIDHSIQTTSKQVYWYINSRNHKKDMITV